MDLVTIGTTGDLAGREHRQGVDGDAKQSYDHSLADDCARTRFAEHSERASTKYLAKTVPEIRERSLLWHTELPCHRPTESHRE